MLLDEPFSNLDAQLRESTRMELRRLQQSLGLTAVFVTHDQAEAMAIADRIAVMNRGRVEQVGSPQAIYSRPASRFVAGFIGRANLIEGAAEPDGAGALLRTERGLTLRLPEPARGRVCAVLRPEAVALVPEAEAAASGGEGAGAAGTVGAVTFLGAVAQIEIDLDSGDAITAEGPGALAARFAPGTRVHASWPPDSLAICAA